MVGCIIRKMRRDIEWHQKYVLHDVGSNKVRIKQVRSIWIRRTYLFTEHRVSDAELQLSVAASGSDAGGYDVMDGIKERNGAAKELAVLDEDELNPVAGDVSLEDFRWKEETNVWI